MAGFALNVWPEKKEIPMKDLFYVDRKPADYQIDGSYDWFSTLEKAEEYARQKAWNDGVEFFIFKPIAKAEAPEQINTVKISQIS